MHFFASPSSSSSSSWWCAVFTFETKESEYQCRTIAHLSGRVPSSRIEKTKCEMGKTWKTRNAAHDAREKMPHSAHRAGWSTCRRDEMHLLRRTMCAICRIVDKTIDKRKTNNWLQSLQTKNWTLYAVRLCAACPCATDSCAAQRQRQPAKGHPSFRSVSLVRANCRLYCV